MLVPAVTKAKFSLSELKMSYEEVEVQLHLFLTSPLDGVSGQLTLVPFYGKHDCLYFQTVDSFTVYLFL